MQVETAIVPGNKITSTQITDLYINECPMGCGNCAGIYVNEITGHRIVCQCRACDHTRS